MPGTEWISKHFDIFSVAKKSPQKNNFHSTIFQKHFDFSCTIKKYVEGLKLYYQSRLVSTANVTINHCTEQNVKTENNADNTYNTGTMWG